MIKISSSPNGITKVYQDGTELHGIKEVKFIHNAMDNQPHMMIEFSDDKVEIAANVIPELPGFYQQFYERKTGTC